MSMFPAIALLTLTSLFPTEANQLSLTGVRLSYGKLGPTRLEAKVLPGDSLFVGFDIEGITVDDAGKVSYSTSLELSDSKGKVFFKQAPRDLEATNSLGGGTMAAFAQVDIGVEQPAGQYSLKLIVTDRIAKKSQELVQKFEVLPKGFGLVRVAISTDPEGQYPVAMLGTGQALTVHAAAVGFVRDKTKKQPNLTFELSVIDEKGNATIKKPATGAVNKDVPAAAQLVAGQFDLALNRAGNFTVEIKATDLNSGATYTEKFPLTVLPSGK
jgi:hypothetical protein